MVYVQRYQGEIVPYGVPLPHPQAFLVGSVITLIHSPIGTLPCTTVYYGYNISQQSLFHPKVLLGRKTELGERIRPISATEDFEECRNCTYQ